MFQLNDDSLSNVDNVMVDAAYTGEPFVSYVASILGATAEVAERADLHTFALISQRWNVERSFPWLKKRRCL
jgi:transposase